MPELQKGAGLSFGLATEITKAFGKFVAARQRQPAPLQVQKVLFHFWIGVRRSLTRTVVRVLQALANLLAPIAQHGLLPWPSGGSTTTLSVSDAWDLLPVMQ